MSYYMLECLVPRGEERMSPYQYPQLEGIHSWLLGSPFAQPPAEPIQLLWNPDTEGGKKQLYSATVPLVHRDLLQALQSLGVDNLDCYSTDITHPVTAQIDREFFAFNVIGAVKAADLAGSRYADPSGRGRIDMDFDSLAISDAAARGLPLFRLAECVSGLVVHERIRHGLEAMGGFGLSFVAPEDWIG
jgi:hypothetical protein